MDKSKGLSSSTADLMLRAIGRAREVGGAQMQNEFLEGGKVMEGDKLVIGPYFYDLPDGEIRTTRKKWPRNSSPVVVNIVFEGLVFTVAKAQIAIGADTKPKAIYTAEGISRISPVDEERRDPMVGKERAIQQAIRALHTRVMKHRRSLHHYRG